MATAIQRLQELRNEMSSTNVRNYPLKVQTHENWCRVLQGAIDELAAEEKAKEAVTK